LSTAAPNLSEDADDSVKIILLRLLKLNSIGLAAHIMLLQRIINSLLSFHRM